MKAISSKLRLRLSIVLLALAIVAFIISIIIYTDTMQLWVIIIIPAIAFITFIVSIIIFPRFKDDGTPIAEPKQKTQKTIHCKTENSKKPFISEKEWDELDEEDEECNCVEKETAQK